MQPHIAHAGEKAHSGASTGAPLVAPASAPCSAIACAAYSIPQATPKPAVRAQRIIERAVRAAAAADVVRIPVDHLIEQAHAALMGNVRLDPCAVHAHGSTCTAMRDTSRYSRIARPATPPASRPHQRQRTRGGNRDRRNASSSGSAIVSALSSVSVASMPRHRARAFARASEPSRRRARRVWGAWRCSGGGYSVS